MVDGKPDADCKDILWPLFNSGFQSTNQKSTINNPHQSLYLRSLDFSHPAAARGRIKAPFPRRLCIQLADAPEAHDHNQDPHE
jgi:hypothetical protein